MTEDQGPPYGASEEFPAKLPDAGQDATPEDSEAEAAEDHPAAPPEGYRQIDEDPGEDDSGDG
jgi:hypothetical protein